MPKFAFCNNQYNAKFSTSLSAIFVHVSAQPLLMFDGICILWYHLVVSCLITCNEPYCKIATGCLSFCNVLLNNLQVDFNVE